jgi:hypothetical protein
LQAAPCQRHGPSPGTNSPQDCLSPGSAFAQPVHAQHALLLDALDGHEEHLRAPRGLADGLRVVGVVLAAGTLAAMRGVQVNDGTRR